MKVLFIHPYSRTPQFPVGIGFLSSMLKNAGHNTGLVALESQESGELLLEAVKTWKPEMIAFSSMSSMFQRVQDLSTRLRKEFRDIFQVCGGIHPTLVPECIEKAPLDGIFRGEGEYALVELAERLSQGRDYSNVGGFWFKVKGKVIRNPLTPLISNLNELPMPDHDLYHSQNLPGKVRGRAEFMFARGCPFDCTYCSNHAVKALYPGQKYLRYPTVEKAINELMVVTRKYAINYIVIHDDTFSLNRRWFQDFCQEYRDKINIPFLCNVRPGTCTMSMFSLLKEANCDAVAIGVESGNSFIREHVLNRKIDDEVIMDTFRKAHEAGIRTHSFSMIGVPYETPHSVVDTIKLTAKLGAFNTPWNYVFHPYPGTKLRQLCQEKSWLGSNLDGYQLERSVSVLNLPGLKRKHIKAYRDNFEILLKLEKQILGDGTSKRLLILLRRLYSRPNLLFVVKFYYYAHRLKEIGPLRALSILLGKKAAPGYPRDDFSTRSCMPRLR